MKDKKKAEDKSDAVIYKVDIPANRSAHCACVCLCSLLCGVVFESRSCVWCELTLKIRFALCRGPLPRFEHLQGPVRSCDVIVAICNFCNHICCSVVVSSIHCLMVCRVETPKFEVLQPPAAHKQVLRLTSNVGYCFRAR